MRFWYDTEFYEDGEQIHLISIGIVAEDGREFYQENSDFDWERVPWGHWLWDNVYPHLEGNDSEFARNKKTLAANVQYFLTEKGHDNELWGYYSDYDHVVLAQMFGRMVDMPEGIPWYTLDIKQLCVEKGVSYEDLPTIEGNQHHALNDARWNKRAWEFLNPTGWGLR